MYPFRRAQRTQRRLQATLWLALSLSTAWVRSAEPAPPATAVSLADVSRTMAGVKTVFTHFVQERHLALLNEPLRSEGYLCFEQPGRIRWEVTRPYRSILVSDGSGVAQFEWVDNKWKKLDLGLAAAMQQVVSQIAGVMKGQYARENREYSVSLASANGGPVITLTPRQEKMRKMMQAIEVHLAPDLKATRRVILREKDGDYTEIQFDAQFVNVSFPSQTFDRQSPAELEGIRQIAAQAGR